MPTLLPPANPLFSVLAMSVIVDGSRFFNEEPDHSFGDVVK
ncbi:MAG: hypothetical protein UY09_C0055G0008, partial [Parcubacteria group bacterium GW2011_GWA2_47_8]